MLIFDFHYNNLTSCGKQFPIGQNIQSLFKPFFTFLEESDF